MSCYVARQGAMHYNPKNSVLCASVTFHIFLGYSSPVMTTNVTKYGLRQFASIKICFTN